MRAAIFRAIWVLLGVTLALGVLGLIETTRAQSPEARRPFDNAVEQRREMLAELRAIKALLSEQNALLRDALRAPPRHAPQP